MSDDDRKQEAKRLLDTGESKASIAETLGVSRSTIVRWFKPKVAAPHRAAPQRRPADYDALRVAPHDAPQGELSATSQLLSRKRLNSAEVMEILGLRHSSQLTRLVQSGALEFFQVSRGATLQFFADDVERFVASRLGRPGPNDA